ncbi:MAG TPA: protein-glutamate O-methyltransferase CheR [Mariprofundaceae bacterium]|nr:protein-glutamate O-methyltransferase CheR [Mariprofundaceae bacterium]
MDEARFNYIRDFLRRRSGLVLDEAKAYLLETRMFPVMKQHGLDSLNALANAVQRDENGEIALDAVHAMTTNESLFFRDKYPFEALREHIFPELEERLGPYDRVNIWSAACSKGQEPYSIAMTAIQSLSNANRRVRITASDLDRQILQYAETGKYTQMEVQRGLAIQQLVRYFDQQGEMWRIRDEIRNLVSFQYANLISDALLQDLDVNGSFHVVFCRNVLIYFDPEERKHVIDRIAHAMVPGGYLITGAAETVKGVHSDWEIFSFSGRRLWRLKKR